MRPQIAWHEGWIKPRREQWDNGRCTETIASAPNLIGPDAAPLRERPNASAHGLLSLAATPTFAIMALLSGVLGGGPDMLCSAAHGASPLSGMVLMYLLMGAFHSAPWLKLISSRRSAARRS